MLQYEVLNVQGTQSVTLYTSSTQPTAVDFTRGEVRLLRRKSFKNDFFTPVVSTHNVMLIFPNSCAPGGQPAASTQSEPAALSNSSSVAARDDTSRDVYVTTEAQTCIAHFLSRLEHIPFRIAYAAACSFSGCAVLVLACPDMEDVLDVQQLCADVARQGNDMRTSNLYVRSSTCAAPTPTTATAEVLATHYYVPTCPLCSDRLESTVSGHSTQTPLCTCAREGHAHQCTCFLSSACLVCRRFAESLEHARQPHDGQQQPPPPVQAIKCEACAKAGDPWICLICGYVGCSRYQAMHAKDHCVAQQHFFSMNLLTQQIWDYDGDCFVHRVVILLDNSTGGSTRMQFPSREDPLLGDGVDGAAGIGGEAVPDTPEAWKAEKKNISAKYDKTLISSHTQYAMVIKSELDAKRAFYASQLIQEGGMGQDGDDDSGEEHDGGGGVEAGADAVVSAEESEREALFDLAKAFEPVESVLADVAARRRKVTAMGYAVRNLEHELDMRAAETGRLEKQLETLKKELRAAIQQNVATDLRLSGSIHDMKETLRDIALNAETQRRLAAQLGGSQVSRLVVVGGSSSSGGGGSSTGAASSSANTRKKSDKLASKHTK